MLGEAVSLSLMRWQDRWQEAVDLSLMRWQDRWQETDCLSVILNCLQIALSLIFNFGKDSFFLQNIIHNILWGCLINFLMISTAFSFTVFSHDIYIATPRGIFQYSNLTDGYSGILVFILRHQGTHFCTHFF